MAEPSRIEPRLSAFDTAMVVVSLVIGIGIFRTPALVAGSAGGVSSFYAAWLLGGCVSLLGALTYAEIGSRLPRAGGYYKAVAECYHPLLAFMLNWSQALLQGAGAAGVAFIGAEYLDHVLLPLAARTPQATLATACLMMLVLLALNWLGIRTGSRAQNLLSLAKVVMIVGLALAGLAFAPGAPSAADAARATGPTLPAATTLAGFATAAVAVFYSYGGYQCAMNLGGDVRDPRRNLPRAVTGGVMVVVVLYLLINLAYERVLGLSGVAASPLVAAALARAAFGPSGELVVSLAIFLSAAGFVNATILQMPRSYYAMAQDGALPAAFLRVDGRTQVQRTGLLFFAATMLGPAFLLGSFDRLLNYVMFSDGLALATVASTLFVLRKRQPRHDGFRMPGYPLLPAAFVACLLAVSARILVSDAPIALAGLGILLAGAPLFVLARRLSAPRA